MYLLLADLIVVLHLLFIVFAVFGGLLLLVWHRLIWLHIPVVLWAALTEFLGLICPLTPLEIWLRQQAGADAYQGGFISQYLVPLIYPPGLTPGMQWLLGGGLVIFNVLIYSWLLVRKRKSKRNQKETIA
jgi:hypothetical protein